jgi:hypothetical protein
LKTWLHPAIASIEVEASAATSATHNKSHSAPDFFGPPPPHSAGCYSYFLNFAAALDETGNWNYQ